MPTRIYRIIDVTASLVASHHRLYSADVLACACYKLEEQCVCMLNDGRNLCTECYFVGQDRERCDARGGYIGRLGAPACELQACARVRALRNYSR